MVISLHIMQADILYTETVSDQTIIQMLVSRIHFADL